MQLKFITSCIRKFKKSLPSSPLHFWRFLNLLFRLWAEDFIFSLPVVFLKRLITSTTIFLHSFKLIHVFLEIHWPKLIPHQCWLQQKDDFAQHFPRLYYCLSIWHLCILQHDAVYIQFINSNIGHRLDSMILEVSSHLIILWFCDI